MDFFMGFLTSSLAYGIFTCIFVFLREEFSKNKIYNIIPGQQYYVQSIGKVTVTNVENTTVTYRDEDENHYTADGFLFLSFSKLALKETKPLEAAKKPRKPIGKNLSYYDGKGKIFDVYVD